MEDRPRPPDPFAAFVVDTRRKPDGRFIHYYEWPGRPPEPGPARQPRTPAAPKRDRRRV